jgi:hypothetical protein
MAPEDPADVPRRERRPRRRMRRRCKIVQSHGSSAAGLTVSHAASTR